MTYSNVNFKAYAATGLAALTLVGGSAFVALMPPQRGQAAQFNSQVNAPASAPAMAQATAQQPRSRTFPETQKTVRGRFLEYWEQNGGLAQQGFPISGEMQERSDTDGKTYTVQYFERAVFELHPENARPYDVLLSLLGNFYYKQKYPRAGGAPNQRPNTTPGSVQFSETGKRLGGRFLQYWNQNGGLAQQGFPISDEFEERSDTDGKIYTVQYFERAVFEYHPEQTDPKFQVLLSLLGNFYYKQKYLVPTQLPTRPIPIPVITGVNGQPIPTPVRTVGP